MSKDTLKEEILNGIVDLLEESKTGRSDLDHFLTDLNALVSKSKKRYIPDVITLYYNSEQVLIGWNKNDNLYEVVADAN